MLVSLPYYWPKLRFSYESVRFYSRSPGRPARELAECCGTSEEKVTVKTALASAQRATRSQLAGKQGPVRISSVTGILSGDNKTIRS